MTSPSFTTTAPIGTSSWSIARAASRSASRMKYSSRGKKCELTVREGTVAARVWVADLGRLRGPNPPRRGRTPTLMTAGGRRSTWRERHHARASLSVVAANRGHEHLGSYVRRDVRNDDLVLRLSDHVEELAPVREVDVDVVVDRHRRANRRLALFPADLERAALTADAQHRHHRRLGLDWGVVGGDELLAGDLPIHRGDRPDVALAGWSWRGREVDLAAVRRT